MSALKSLGGFFDIPTLTTKVEELELQSQSNDIWNDAAKAKAVMRERAQCAERLEAFKKLETLKGDAETAFEIAKKIDHFLVSIRKWLTLGRGLS